MTIAELIEKLKEYPQDLRVVVRGYEGGVDDVSCFEEMEIYLKMTNNLYTIKFCLWEETPNKVHLYIQDTHSINTKQKHIYQGWFINYDSAIKHINCYSRNNFSLIESGDDEKVYNSGSLKICKYFKFSKIKVEIND